MPKLKLGFNTDLLNTFYSKSITFQIVNISLLI